MDISVIIPAYNEEKYLATVLSSIKKNAPANLKEIIVVNNASTDNTEEVAKSFEGVKVVFEKEKGLTRARQAGMEASSGDLIASVDADSIVPDHWFETLNREFNSDPNLVLLSGPYLYYDTPRWQQWAVRVLYYGLLARFIYFFTRYMASGGNFVAK